MAKIGYARVSSKEQHLDRQLAALKEVDKLFTDKLSGANTNRPELQKMLAYIREGDIVLVTELDRLGSQCGCPFQYWSTCEIAENQKRRIPCFRGSLFLYGLKFTRVYYVAI